MAENCVSFPLPAYPSIHSSLSHLPTSNPPMHPSVYSFPNLPIHLYVNPLIFSIYCSFPSSIYYLLLTYPLSYSPINPSSHPPTDLPLYPLIYTFIHLPIHLPIYPSINLYSHPFIHLFVRLSIYYLLTHSVIYPSIHSSSIHLPSHSLIHPSTSLSVHLYTITSIYPPFHLSTCPLILCSPICPHMYPSVNLTVHPLILPSIYSSTCTHTQPFIHSLTHPPIHSCIHQSTHPWIHLPILLSPIHSCFHLPIPKYPFQPVSQPSRVSSVPKKQSPRTQSLGITVCQPLSPHPSLNRNFPSLSPLWVAICIPLGSGLAKDKVALQVRAC